MDTERRRNAVTKDEFTLAINGIHSRLDTQDSKLAQIDDIRVHIKATCAIVRYAWMTAKAIGAAIVAILPLGKMMGWW